MNVKIQTVHFDADDKLVDYVTKKLILKYFDKKRAVWCINSRFIIDKIKIKSAE